MPRIREGCTLVLLAVFDLARHPFSELPLQCVRCFFTANLQCSSPLRIVQHVHARSAEDDTYALISVFLFAVLLP